MISDVLARACFVICRYYKRHLTQVNSRDSFEKDAPQQHAIFTDSGFGGAVGVLPPESENPNRRVLQAQLRICSCSSVRPEAGLSARRRSLILRTQRIGCAR